MTFQVNIDEYHQSLEQLVLNLPPENQVELVLLKGHLAIEALLDKYFQINLIRPEKIKKIRLTYSNKLALVAAMYDGEECEWLWSSIKELNKLRNKLSHQLDSLNFIIELKEFITTIESLSEYEIHIPPNDEYKNLRRSIFCLHEALSLRINT